MIGWHFFVVVVPSAADRHLLITPISSQCKQNMEETNLCCCCSVCCFFSFPPPPLHFIISHAFALSFFAVASFRCVRQCSTALSLFPLLFASPPHTHTHTQPALLTGTCTHTHTHTHT